MSADPARSELDDAILDWMREPDWDYDEARFEALAQETFRYQYNHCEVYKRFCDGRGRVPGRVESWREIPAVPTGAFKETELRSFPPERTVHRFQTSGTSTAVRGTLYLDSLKLYEASLLPSFRRFVFPELESPGDRAAIRVLAPSSREFPESSLSHMFQIALAELGASGSGFDVESGELLVDRILTNLVESAASESPIALCGTAFSFVHLIDHLSQRGVMIGLPPASRVMETGGFKGQSREMPRAELYSEIKRVLGVSAERIVNQYGMTELGSQFYDSVLHAPTEPRRKLGPPWARVVIIDPETGHESVTGQVGTICVFDLANSGSIAAIETGDLGRAVLDGFEVIGREPGAEARGCSIAADELLGRDST